jgi:hypothetical protein
MDTIHQSILLAYLTKNLYRTERQQIDSERTYGSMPSPVLSTERSSPSCTGMSMSRRGIYAHFFMILAECTTEENRTEEFENRRRRNSTDVVSVSVEMKKLEYSHVEVGYISDEQMAFCREYH